MKKEHYIFYLDTYEPSSIEQIAANTLINEDYSFLIFHQQERISVITDKDSVETDYGTINNLRTYSLSKSKTLKELARILKERQDRKQAIKDFELELKKKVA